ncbi:MAG: thiamine-phosphate kinase [Euryarchaeota archaeon]|nr:thiamine-phosphate kinase [Euryarchaeota archaeon]
MHVKLRNIGERKAIDAIWQVLGRKIEYDDCAFVLKGEKYELFTTDFVGEGSHFVPEVAPETLGEFIASVNLSDIAAMGGMPDYFLLSAFMPGDSEFEFLESVIKGLVRTLDRFGVRYLGGDLKESELRGFSGFAVGHVEKEKIMLRKGAKVGDTIALTGPLGGPGAAYLLWKRGRMEFDEILKIVPRIEEGRALAGRASTCMDTSDGIFSSLMQMQSINELGFDVDIENIPLHPLAREVIEDGLATVDSLLNFGGEYELLYTAPKLLTGYDIGAVTAEKREYGKGYEHFSKILD